MNEEQKRKTTKVIVLLPVIFLAIVAAVIVFALVSPSRSKGDGWEVVSTDYYARDGKKCLGYRVYVDHRADSSELREIFDTVTQDSYYLHTVWFFLDKSAADGSDSAWKTLEETAPGYVR